MCLDPLDFFSSTIRVFSREYERAHTLLMVGYRCGIYKHGDYKHLNSEAISPSVCFLNFGDELRIPSYTFTKNRLTLSTICAFLLYTLLGTQEELSHFCMELIILVSNPAC